MNWKLCLGLICVALGNNQAAVPPGKVQLVSAPLGVSGQPGPGNGTSSGSILSGDGRIVAFISGASNLVTNDLSGGILGGYLDVFARDLQAGTTQLVSANPAGTSGGKGNSFLSGVSRDGGQILFESDAPDLASNDRNNVRDVFVRDLVRGVTVLVSANIAGDSSGNGESANATITPDGRFVVFESDASNLVAVDTNGVRDVFVRDLVNGTTTLVSKSATGNTPGNGASDSATISADGLVVLFSSAAANLAAGDTNNLVDLFLRDMRTAVTVNLTGTLRAFSVPIFENYQSALSSDGRHVVFRAGDGSTATRNPDDGVLYWRDLQAATNVVAARLNTTILRGDLDSLDISADGRYVLYGLNGSLWRWDAESQTTVSVYPDGSGFSPAMTSDGRWIAFLGLATNAAPAGEGRVLLRDMATNTNTLISIRPDGGPSTGNDIALPSLSEDGRRVSFDSLDSRLAPGDVNRTYDSFVRDVMAGTTMLASLARPGSGSTTGDGSSRFEPAALSADGRYLLFSSIVETLVPNDTNGFGDIFLFDRERGTNQLVSVNRQGTGSANGVSTAAILSANGLVAGFFSSASNLTADKTNNVTDFYVRDLARGITRRIDPTRFPGSAISAGVTLPALSGDGRFLAFVRGDTVYRLDLINDRATNVVRAGTGIVLAINGDGGLVAVSGSLTQQVLWDANTGLATRIASLNPGFDSFAFGADGNALFLSHSQSGFYQVRALIPPSTNLVLVTANLTRTPQLSTARPDVSASADGSRVAFVSADEDLVVRDINKLRDVFVRDVRAGTNILVSVNAKGDASGNGTSDSPRLSADGRYVLFRSDATDLVAGEPIPAAAIFLRDLNTGVTTLVSRNHTGTGGPNLRTAPPALSRDGTTAYFSSLADDLVPGDENTQSDVFVVRLEAGTPVVTDSDHDGLPDDWERQYFGDLTRDGAGDFDNDGFSDRDELGAGTNPANRESALRVELLHIAEVEWSLRWSSVAGKTYRIQTRFTLNSGAWTDVPGETVGNGGVLIVPLPAVIDDEGRFFRLVVR